MSRREWAAVGALVAVGAFLRLWQVDLGFFSLHTARDLYRAQLLLRGVEFPLLGSELQYGGRVFGPLMYLLCALPLAIATSPVSVAVFIALLNTALLPVVWRFARAFFGPGAALWALALYAVFPLEVAQLRFYWNPCFLPAVVTGALIGLFQVAVRGRPWHFVTLVLFIGLGLQLHMSAAELFVSAGAVLLIARRRIPARVWVVAGLVLLALFTPLIAHELFGGQSDIVAVVTSPDTHRGPIERFAFNPNGLRNFFYHVRLQMHERGGALGFACLETVPLIGPVWIGPRKMALAEAINLFGQVQLLLWALGVGVCLAAIRRHRRDAPRLTGDDLEASRRRMIAHSALLVWQAVPTLFCSFFNYQGQPGEDPSLAPLRYYLVSYPAPFLTSALGLVALARLAGRWRGAIFALGGALVASQFVFCLLYLQVLERSGRSIPYLFPNLAPTMRAMMQIRDILLGEAGLDRDAWYERTHAQQLGDLHFGEATFDWLITQDPRSVTNPPPDPHLRWLLHSPMPASPEPRLPEGATEVRRWALRDTGMTVVEYRVADPQAPVPDNLAMRNFYFRNERMLYLGPGADLRARVMAEEGAAP